MNKTTQAQTTQAQSTPETTRALDPNVLQNRASNPQSSIWVNASAGTGKTKVLTDRVLRLLLPQDNGEPGHAAHKILGLTFTKAAASEMAIRINETLAQWAIMPLEDSTNSDNGTVQTQKGLTTTLKNLLGRRPNDHDINAARKLFTQVIDTPGRLKIMTIHSFCQSLLARFPLEAKLTPGFTVIEERTAQEYLTRAKQHVFQTINDAQQATHPITAAIESLSRTVNETQLDELIESIAGEREQLTTLLTQHFGIDGLYTKLCQDLNIQAGQSTQDILLNACKDQAFNRDGLKRCADAMAGHTAKTDKEHAALIYDFLASNIDERLTKFESYQSVFFKKDGDPRAKLIAKPLSDADPTLLDIMTTECQRLQKIDNTCKAATMCLLTRDLLLLGTEILNHYEHIKERHNVLDYEDLIFKATKLLQSSNLWVHYKLDEGIDHILIDEAQDTNPEQWKIIEALCREFFAQHSEAETNRTVFTVGDEKQSIYSFQRASPEEFEKMRQNFTERVQKSGRKWQEVDLNISFRSTKSILNAVDNIFAPASIRKGLGLNTIHHESFRRGQAGKVEVWPVFENDPKNGPKNGSDHAQDNPDTPWTPPTTLINQKSGANKLAESIADHIKNRLDNNEILPSYARAIQPKDIMILVRTRNAFVSQMMRALKSRDIPVGGLDRMILNDQLAVQDILAAVEFCLLPEDDLNLACLLKSPLIGMEEETLFDLAYNRTTSLWEVIGTQKDQATKTITAYLNALKKDAKTLSPYAFLDNILQSPCPADNMSGLRAFQKRLGIDAHESLNELLNAALNFERDHTLSLQEFLQWQKQDSGDIKRQQDEQSNHVRIMTIHGSKGLQAPIVFLPDTTSSPGLSSNQAGNRLLWPTQTGKNLPLWTPKKDTEPDEYNDAKTTVIERLQEEYRRLLYVALTRAESELYITGYKGKNDIKDDCWYRYCYDGLQNHDRIIEQDNGALILENEQTGSPDRSPSKHSTTETETHHTASQTKIPDWFFTPAPQENATVKVIQPSQLRTENDTLEEPDPLSPLQSANEYRFRRGNVTHTLLQFLPDIAEEQRIDHAKAYMDRYATDLSHNIRDNIIKEIATILDNPDFAPLFGPGSKAETPITGQLADGTLIHGQVDRLCITDNEILIVDYKTNRPPPTDPKDIPDIYRNQLQAYADLLKEIYPHHTIKAALLWTDGPTLMPVDLKIMRK